MLIAQDGRYAGLLSGGCLEGDLAGHARVVFERGAASLVSYDMRTPDDLLFGLGSGCEGSMDILLIRLDPARDWQPMSRLAQAWQMRRSASVLLVVKSGDPLVPAGSGCFPADGEVFGIAECRQENSRARLRHLVSSLNLEGPTRLLVGVVPGVDLLLLQQARPVQLLVLGAGPDARPVVALATQLGWSVTVVDHRSHYAQLEHFPGAAAVLDGGTTAAAEMLKGPNDFAAAVVMSHHMNTDLAYLRVLARSDVPYVGLLGPAQRRAKLLSELGSDAERLTSRLRAPVGLAIGADTPEAIAVSIVAEIHAALAGRTSAATIIPVGVAD